MAQTKEMVAYFNGKLVPYGLAVAGVSNGESGGSAGFYDAERTFKGEVFKLRDHLRRLYRNLDAARIDPGLSMKKMEAATLQVVEANRPLLNPGDDFVVGQVVNATTAAAGKRPPRVNVTIYCQVIDFANFASGYVRGARVITPATYAVPPPASPDGANVPQPSVYSLLSDDKGNITECRHANFFFVADGRIKLPDRGSVLPGVSMETVLELADFLEIAVDEDHYTTYDVYMADEAFVSGTQYCVLPVATLNGLRLGEWVPGPVTRRLQSAWSKRVGVDFVQQALKRLPAEDTMTLLDIR